MDNNQNRLFPFLTRDFLRFKHGATYSLRVVTQSSDTSDIVITGMTRDGTFRRLVTLDGIGGEQIVTIPLTDFPIFVSVADNTGSMQQGSCYASVELLANQERFMTLVTGFVYSVHGITWPPINNDTYMPGMGKIRHITGTNPAAGVEISETVPAGRTWELLSISFTLVAAAAAASRRVHLKLTNELGGEIDVFGNTDQIISETRKYCFAQYGHVLDEIDDGVIQIPLPQKIYLKQDSTITTDTTNLQGGDDFSAPSINVMEYFQKQI